MIAHADYRIARSRPAGPSKMKPMSSLPDTSASTVTSSTAAQAPQIEAVLFDYGQVLSLGPNPTAWEKMRATTGGSAEQFHAAYWTPRHDYDRGTLDGTAYWLRVASDAGHPGLTEADLHTLYGADVDLWTDLNEPMVLWARSLQNRNIRTGILSNIGDRMETGIRERFDWIGHFDHCTWSHALKMAKPEIEIYQHAAEGLGTNPERVLFIDDREENIRGARAAGMVALLYSTHADFVEQMQQMGLGELL